MLQSSMFEPGVLTKDNGKVLSDLRARVASCTECKLCEGRTQTVFGHGNQDRPAIALIGESPSSGDEAAGLLFQGGTGVMLDKMLGRIGYKREDLYVCTVVCCRVPEGKNPSPEQVLACQPYLFSQLRLVRPRTIITLGNTATEALLRKNKFLAEMRGKWWKWENVPVRPTWHPNYLARNPKDRSSTLVDLEAVVNYLRNPANSAES